MVAQHIVLDAPQGVNDCRDLMNDVETIALRVNHLTQSAHLSFDAIQSRTLPVVVDFNAAVRGLVRFFVVFFQFRWLLKLYLRRLARTDGRFS